MSEKQETLEVHRFNAEKLGMPFYVDIGTSVVAVRRTSNHDVIWRADHAWGGNVWIDEAKRICAIMNEEARHTVGNGAKMREALVEISNLADALDVTNPNVVAILDECSAALAEPARNCDVGTVDEQTERFVDFARLYFQSEVVRFALNWAQMPYEEGGDK